MEASQHNVVNLHFTPVKTMVFLHTCSCPLKKIAARSADIKTDRMFMLMYACMYSSIPVCANEKYTSQPFHSENTSSH